MHKSHMIAAYHLNAGDAQQVLFQNVAWQDML